MNEKSINISARVQSLQTVIDFLEESLKCISASRNVVHDVRLSVEEMFVNIALYAYEGGEGKVKVSISLTNDGSKNIITIVFQDSGKQFNPLLHDDPDISIPLAEREIGGLGIFLVKKSMDDVRYEYLNAHNITTMVKILERDKHGNMGKG
ncbi:MAG: ATP-binding protein [Termitinemataceae bacterium]|nr:MAG: ATP-binding protein [Termitinemataceae bacterium]